jgi:pimeloyl-ACP methyl ester carboxylesterase
MHRSASSTRATIPRRAFNLLILAVLFFLPSSVYPDSPVCDPRRIDRDLGDLKAVLEDWPARAEGKKLADMKALFLATAKALVRCVDEHPDDPTIAWRLGECYRLGNNLEAQTQQVADSKKYLDRALELDQAYMPAYISLGKLCIQAYRKMLFERPGAIVWEMIYIADDYFTAALERCGSQVAPDIYKGLSFTPHYSNPSNDPRYAAEAIALATRYLSSNPNDQTFERIFQTYKIRERVLEEDTKPQEETLIFLPPDYRDGVRYPVIIFLPCTGGSALRTFKAYTPVMELFSFIAILPYGTGSEEDHTGEGFAACIARYEPRIEEALASARSAYGIDEERIIVAGYSLGGDLSWALSMRHPQRYRGAIMMGTRCGYPASTETLETLRRRDFRAFFVTGDDELPARLKGIRAANELLTSKRIRTVYVERPGGHDPATIQEFKQALDFILK